MIASFILLLIPIVALWICSVAQSILLDTTSLAVNVFEDEDLNTFRSACKSLSEKIQGAAFTTALSFVVTFFAAYDHMTATPEEHPNIILLIIALIALVHCIINAIKTVRTTNKLVKATKKRLKKVIEQDVPADIIAELMEMADDVRNRVKRGELSDSEAKEHVSNRLDQLIEKTIEANEGKNDV